MKKLIFIFFTFLTLMVSAQEVEKKALEVHTIEGKEYYIHIVEAGNTLYAISRRYAIPVEELKKENPRLTKELTIGDRLLIPLKEVKRKNLDENMEIDGNFLIHEVQKKNTLYSIAKEYNVEIAEIVAENPMLTEGLKKGMKVKIPIAKIKSEVNEREYIVPASVSPYVTHLVMPKETLYSLSKKYGVTTDSILMVNNGLAGGLKVDQLINIPTLRTYVDTSRKEVITFDSLRIKDRYKVALMLPFYLDFLEEIKDSLKSISDHSLNAFLDKSQYALEFYQGFKLAADSISKRGLRIDLHVFDTENDPKKVQKLISADSLEKMDLIVGPFYIDVFMKVADYAKQNEINIVSPVKLSNKILLGNNYASKVSTSETTLLKTIAYYAYSSFKDSSLHIVYPDHLKEREAVNTLKREMLKLKEKNLGDSLALSQLKESVFTEKDFSTLKAKFSLNRMNYIIVPSEDQAFVTQFLTNLKMQEDYQFTVLGLPAWEKYDNIELSYFEQLHVQLPVFEHLDRNRISVKSFEKKFLSNYGFVPDYFSYLGYDIGYYYLDLLRENGSNFNALLPNKKFRGLSRKFDFHKTGIESGFENNSVYIIEYRNFEKTEVRGK